MVKLRSIISAFRPKTLSASLVPCLAGTSLCWFEGFNPSWSVFLYALLSAMSIQVGTNLVNDAMDFKKGADTEDRIGPSRITQQGILTYKQVLTLAGFFFFLAVLLGLPLVLLGGWVIVAVGVFSILMGYAYTSGPYPLAYVGLGDLFVIFFFGIVAVMGIHYLHWGEDYPGILLPPLILGLQVGFLSTVLIAINNLRDI
ncbi:MAG TPA: 1,4-dihydroxy-2-naphthoate octaprenyltransferase, partial [Pseudobdellovibrionaceae bacterium]|nr:1,4-dihydroxy-2-naphthoate octaprenyltransferase [Pseudobdellovibrionaceae bacterium]